VIYFNFINIKNIMTIINGSSQLGIAIFVGLAFATICFTALFICKKVRDFTKKEIDKNEQ